MLSERTARVDRQTSTYQTEARALWTEQEHAIATPEQVDLRFPLAGLGSRFLAVAVDLAIQFCANIVLVIILVLAFSAGIRSGALGRLSDTAQKWFLAGIVLIYFLLYWGYFSLFEAFKNGQTPGKRVMKIRTVKSSGRQVTFFEALARNLLRFVDQLPGVYLVGAVSILLSRQNQRLGDLLADTIVVHERVDEFAGYLPLPPAVGSHPAGTLGPLHGTIPADRIALLEAGDLHVVTSYLSRALALPMVTRATLASRLLDGLCAKMEVAVPSGTSPERILEHIAFVMRQQGRG